jgi:hypothetical protein
MDNKLGYISDRIVELGIATEEEVNLVITINGWNEESLNDILYARTGYRNISQIDEGQEW